MSFTYRVFIDATISSHVRYAIQRPNTNDFEYHVEPFRECGGKEALLVFGICKVLARLTEHAAPVQIITPQSSLAALLKYLLADPLRVHFLTNLAPHARSAYTALLATIGNRPVTFANPDNNNQYVFGLLDTESKGIMAAAA